MARVSKSGQFSNLYLMGTFEFKGTKTRFSDNDSGKSYVFDLKDKDQVERKMGKLIFDSQEHMRKGTFRVTISGNSKKLWNICPTFGDAQVRFVKFSPRQNDIPIPQVKKGEHGSFRTFFVVMEIAEGPLKGLQFASSMFYKWIRGSEDDGDLEGQILYTDLGQNTDYVLGFTDGSGIEDVLNSGFKHPPGDNVLPVLEDIAIRKGKIFAVRFGNDTFQAVARYFPVFSSGVTEIESSQPTESENGWGDDAEETDELENF